MELKAKDVYRLIFKKYPDVMDVKQVWDAIGICDKTAYKLIKAGQLPAGRVGRQHRIAKLHVMTYMEMQIPEP